MANIVQRFKINRDRPTIGITGPDKGGGVAWFFAAMAVRMAGGKPVRITPSKHRTADGLQALIIGGGADIDPRALQDENVINEYLEQTIRKPKTNIFQKVGRFTSWLYYPALFFLRKAFSRKRTWTIDPDRDHLEFQLIDQAVKKGLPVMGICRGSQLINVYFQGTLHQDINAFYLEEPNPSSVFPVKKVYIKRGSMLAQILGTEELEVNALHHQAVKEPGTDLQIVAKESIGITQAIETTTQKFILGVQWHPEYLPQHKEQRSLFKALVYHAKGVHFQIEDDDMEQALSSPRAAALQQMQEQEAALLEEVEGEE
ncbi:gamma-glutamyl-gamma-aminobutyrate hydrolase family protein [Pontibacter harenae]|uniref:gamma-glutamyl-gamma-aminobutyrate hydrolase family protein n=1 Tax=Pontibacter harenae TaxID=2894083 RepID=UPI001E6374BE|nr:gamma-glutamyl-gamma-aminobutyrate hydrolase family protein [Pontibacter harenae]MCC9166622.1 gamma-glutamyl-gamma-aminobutyrate hydrolase family protein [Pontibacter harenae]